MWVHEYQAKRLLAEAGIRIPAGEMVDAAGAAAEVARRLGGDAWIVKAQIHAGARGLAGGVLRVDSPEAAGRAAERLLGTRLATAQTSPSGLPVGRVLVERALDVRQELYVACTLDRAARRLRLMVSGAGGMEVERQHGEMHSLVLDPDTGLRPWACREMAYSLALPARVRAAVSDLLWRLQDLARRRDLLLLEINPLGVLADDTLIAMDAKMQVDDNALARQAMLDDLRDVTQEDGRETRARSYGLSFVALDGDIGCMVNGAGLAMATLDLIRLHGGMPANFLDVGGGTTAERVAQAFGLITEAPALRSILVNIFGGIVRCDLIAEGLLQAMKRTGVRVPVVVRLEGTRAEQGRALLAASGLNLDTAVGLDEAAVRAVQRAREG